MNKEYSSYLRFYSRFLAANAGKQHFASHSHHYWPDVTREAMLEYWDDSCRLTDQKWDFFFTQKIPKVQAQIRKVLHLSESASHRITFAPNTHELVYRLLSCLPVDRPLAVLTTDSEFFSFDRQVRRWAEGTRTEVVRVPQFPIETFEERLITLLKSRSWDFVFLSQIFFNSGLGLKGLDALVHAVAQEESTDRPLFVLDAYHAFMAIPTDWSRLEDRVFYLAGSYKYAQGGEGCCFLVSPLVQLRPQYTGWFAQPGHVLSQVPSQVEYSNDGLRWAGSTMDFAPLYRLSSVLDLFEKNQITVEKIHSHVQRLQSRFLELLDEVSHPWIHRGSLIDSVEKERRGHFLTFDLGTWEKAQSVHAQLLKKEVLTDFRGSRLRFGFGLYQDENFDLDRLKGS